jgi:hypothetical protein
MKGVIVSCLADLVTTKFGKDRWQNALAKAGLDRNFIVLATADVDDQAVLKVVGAVCTELGITLQQAADAFGEHWVCTYAPRTYKAFYKKNAREFLLAMDGVHDQTTRTMTNAHPPRFNYAWEDDKHLVMTYNSARGLMDFFIGLCRGVAKYYKEDLVIERAGANKVRITFP